MWNTCSVGEREREFGIKKQTNFPAHPHPIKKHDFWKVQIKIIRFSFFDFKDSLVTKNCYLLCTQTFFTINFFFCFCFPTTLYFGFFLPVFPLTTSHILNVCLLTCSFIVHLLSTKMSSSLIGIILCFHFGLWKKKKIIFSNSSLTFFWLLLVF